MAKKKRLDFRPDPSGTGLLSKLYITPLQRKAIVKWTLYSLLCIAVLVVQDVILSRLTVFGGVVDLTPCVILLVCVLEGAERGGVFALAASVFYAYSGSAPGLYCIILLTAFAIAVTLFRENFLQRSFSSDWVCTAAAVLGYQLCVYVIGVFLTQTYAGRIGVFLMNALLSSAAMPVVYPAFRAIGKIGGETWKE